jgi:hypothetical protein
MCRPGFLIGLILLAGPAAAQDLQSYPPSKATAAPKFINAEVTKVDKASGLVTFRSESGEVLVTAGREVTANMPLRPGDKVLVAFRDAQDSSGFKSRVVTEVRTTTPAPVAPARKVSVPTAKTPPAAAGGAATTATATQPASTETAAATGAPAAGSPATAGATTPGVTVATGVGATSPYTNPVPSLNTAPPAATAVLPPAGAKAPTSDAEVGANRAQGVRDLDASAVAMAAVANDIDAAWARFKNQCLPGFTPTSASREWYAIADNKLLPLSDDTCRGIYNDLAGRVKTFRGQLDIVEEAARKADVSPAQIREVFDRHKLTR